MDGRNESLCNILIQSVAIYKHGKGFEFGFGHVFHTLVQRDGIINIRLHYISLATMYKTYQKEHKYLTYLILPVLLGRIDDSLWKSK